MCTALCVAHNRIILSLVFKQGYNSKLFHSAAVSKYTVPQYKSLNHIFLVGSILLIQRLTWDVERYIAVEILDYTLKSNIRHLCLMLTLSFLPFSFWAYCLQVDICIVQQIILNYNTNLLKSILESIRECLIDIYAGLPSAITLVITFNCESQHVATSLMKMYTCYKPVLSYGNFDTMRISIILLVLALKSS